MLKLFITPIFVASWLLLLTLAGCVKTFFPGQPLVILDPPSVLQEGGSYLFTTSWDGRDVPWKIHWEARYGNITTEGLYTAPPFPCSEKVAARAGRYIDEVIFPVIGSFVTPPHSIAPNPDSPVSCVDSFRLLSLPLVTSKSQVELSFTVATGEWIVFLNGERVKSGRGSTDRVFRVDLFLREGKNRVTVFCDGENVLEETVWCDTVAPRLTLERALFTGESFFITGRVEDESAVEVVVRSPAADGTHWTAHVPLEGEVAVEAVDAAGNVTAEIFSVERDVRLEVDHPASVKEGSEVVFTFRVYYRDIPAEKVPLTIQWGQEEHVVITNREETVVSFSAQEAGATEWGVHFSPAVREVGSIKVIPRFVAFLDLTVPWEWPLEDIFTGYAFVEDNYGEPWGGKSVTWELWREGETIENGVTVTDDFGMATFSFSFLSSGEHSIRVTCNNEDQEKAMWVLSSTPHVLICDESPDCYVSGTVNTHQHFTALLLDNAGKAVEGSAIEWWWEDEEGKENSVESSFPHERTSPDGKGSITVNLPERAGDWKLHARALHWENVATSWLVRVTPGNIQVLSDLTDLPPVLKSGEDIAFVVRAEDRYGNPPMGEKWIRVTWKKTGAENSNTFKVSTGYDGRAEFFLLFPEAGQYFVKAEIIGSFFGKLEWENLEVEEG